VDITSAADVRSVLQDPAFLVPPAPATDAPVGVAWLRAAVGRFCNGETHDRRRALGTTDLERLDVAGLRQGAFERATALLAMNGRKPFDLMARVARPATVDVLAGALGIVGADAADVAMVGRAYPSGGKPDKKTDRAVARLVAACGGTPDEATAARIGLLVQACDATAGLAGNALIALLTGARSGTAEEVVAAALRDDPPVRATRRVAESPTRIGDAEIAAGTTVVLDLTAARDEQLPFGAGPRSCPGRAQALALAAGIVEACSGTSLAESEIDYLPAAANLGAPASLMILR
jgi:cytochrome P450